MIAARRFTVALVLGVALASAAHVRGATVNGGDLAVNSGPDITDNQLRDWINEFIPAASPRALILTQCYGGNMLDKFKGDTNTYVASATRSGEKAQYKGYDRGATGNLRPLPNPSLTSPPTHQPTSVYVVHSGGYNTRDKNNESTETGGKLDPFTFPITTLRADFTRS